MQHWRWDPRDLELLLHARTQTLWLVGPSPTGRRQTDPVREGQQMEQFRDRVAA